MQKNGIGDDDDDDDDDDDEKLIWLFELQCINLYEDDGDW